MFLFRRRRKEGASSILLILGVLGLLMACPLTLFGVPLSISRAREVASLPRPQAAELASFPIGSEGLFTAQIPNAAAVNDQGLAIAYTETRPLNRETGDDAPANTNWVRETPPPNSVLLNLDNGQPLEVQLTSSTSFANSETIDLAPGDGVERRMHGYRPGQTLTVEGVWEGNGRVSAQTLFHGSADAFAENTASAPGNLLIFGLVCLCLSLGLAAAGGAMRFFGR